MAKVNQKHIEEILSEVKFEINHEVFERTCILAGLLPNNQIIVVTYTFVEGEKYSDDLAMEQTMLLFTEKVAEYETYKHA